MSDTVKFTFDTRFESPGAAARVAVGAASHSPMVTQEELAKAREDAFAQGLAAGLEEARGEVERTIAGALTEISEHLMRLRSADQDRRKEAVSLALAIGRKLAPTLLRREPLAEIEALVSECLAEVPEEPRVVIRVDDVLLDELKRRIDDMVAQSGFGGEIVLLGDDTLQGSDCRIEWADGGAKRALAHLLGEIEAVVDRFTHDREGATAAGRSRTTTDATMDEPTGDDHGRS